MGVTEWPGVNEQQLGSTGTMKPPIKNYF